MAAAVRTINRGHRLVIAIAIAGVWPDTSLGEVTEPCSVCYHGAPLMDHRPSVELLESVHQFPGTYQIKVIGAAQNDFVDRVLAAVSEELPAASDLDHTVRNTRAGRHVALTLEISVQTPEQVRSIYQRLQELDGITLLL